MKVNYDWILGISELPWRIIRRILPSIIVSYDLYKVYFGTVFLITKNIEREKTNVEISVNNTSRGILWPSHFNQCRVQRS